MQATVSLDSLLNFIKGLSLSDENVRWLASKLLESTEHKREQTKDEKKKALVFPKIPRDYKPSPKVLDMTIGSLPQGADWDKETEKMWEEMAR
ncbi:MAG: hypothetical protein Q4D56_10955 [Bacteroides sp.]|nr:hypothetical protein [Bacteroides sp.]